jgi:hypothetical protein
VTLFFRALSFSATIALGGLGSSCTRAGNTWLPGSMSGAARDQIMLVREDPPSFGYQRLNSQIIVYPDLGLFVSKRGVPDFLAESGAGERHYFIFYYLKDRKAYACRVRSGGSRAVEFAGPYPITPREYRLLDGFRKDPHHAPTRF